MRELKEQRRVAAFEIVGVVVAIIGFVAYLVVNAVLGLSLLLISLLPMLAGAWIWDKSSTIHDEQKD